VATGALLLVQLLGLAAAVSASPTWRSPGRRVLLPWHDVPAWSRYSFRVEPAVPRALYDGTLDSG